LPYIAPPLQLVDELSRCPRSLLDQSFHAVIDIKSPFSRRNFGTLYDE
jgi:hypothetical protein